MGKRSLNLKDTSIAFLLAFISSQLMVIFGKLIVSSILAIFSFSSTEISTFFKGDIGYLVTSLFQFLGFICVFVYYTHKTTLKKQCFASKVKPLTALIFIMLGIVSMFALTTFINYYCLTLNLFNKPTATFSYELDNLKTYLISLISLALLPAIGEELIFRGIILNSLKTKSKLFAVIVSSLLFTLIHFNLSQLFYPFLFGILLAFACLKSKNIVLPMLIHFINNAINLTIQYLSNNGTFKPSTLNLIFMIVGAILFLGLLAYLFIISYKEDKLTEQAENKESPQTKPSISENKQPYSFTTLIKSEKFLFYAPIIFMIFIYICTV